MNKFELATVYYRLSETDEVKMFMIFKINLTCLCRALRSDIKFWNKKLPLYSILMNKTT